MRVQKIKCLKELEIDREVSLELLTSLKTKKTTLKKLYIARKVAEIDRIDGELLFKDVQAIFDNEVLPRQKDLIEPEHIMCQIGGFIMEDPVTIQSGRTYDREMITSFFEALKTVRDEEGNEVPPYCPINKI